jgi:localization factor PodJL
MRPDLPWNVAGIPPEAREAARAAARREGLSVGEWLTRRIGRGFADTGDGEELSRETTMSANRMYRAAAQDQAPTRRETDEMLDRVSRSEAQASDVYRRIEEQLRGVARRLDTTERSQSENNRAMNKAATEINIATREQAQAFDQLAGHVDSLADRLGRMEQAGNTASLKDAVKGLHTGLSRLADQIGQNASHTATQISSLATNLEALAARLNEVREAADDNTRTFENRLVALDDRVYGAERAAQSSTDALERIVETLQVHKEDQADAAHREGVAADAIARLEESLEKLEARSIDPEIDRRLGSMERSLADIVSRLETTETVSPKTVEESLRKLVARVEATENRQRDTVGEFRSAMSDQTTRIAALESKPAVVAAAVVAAPPPPAPSIAPPAASLAVAQSSFTPPPSPFDAPPFPDTPTPDAPPPFHAFGDALPAQTQAFEPAPEFAADPPFPPAADFAGGDSFVPPPHTVDSYLTAARRSARAAANQAEAEMSPRGFSWGGTKPESDDSQSRSRTVLIGFVVLIAVALIAGIILSKSLLGPSSAPSSNAGALFPGKTQSPPPQAGTPLHALSSTNDDATSPAAAPAAAAPTVPALEPKVVAPSPVRPVPASPQTTPPQQSANMPAMDRLTVLANAGNAKAETIVGLKYLNGDGVAVNEAQAAKWLERAAESGEPVAQYRLGTLYERGKGVAADPAKATHWYQAAAIQGNRKAMHNLAVAFAEGSGVKKDMNEAARWFSKAASLGLADSEFNLAVLYERGLGVPQSLLDAYKWYAIAAAQGDSESKARIEALATQLTADARAASQHAADTFKPAASDPRANVPPQLNELSQG